MIFEGTKKSIFFGLGLTRAGHAVPDLRQLVVVSKELGVRFSDLISVKAG